MHSVTRLTNAIINKRPSMDKDFSIDECTSNIKRCMYLYPLFKLNEQEGECGECTSCDDLIRFSFDFLWVILKLKLLSSDDHPSNSLMKTLDKLVRNCSI